jgi:hemerythrin
MDAWGDSFLTHHDRIDFEHRVLHDLVSDFLHSSQAGATTAKLLRILDEIALYAKFHVKSEENIMHDLGYPDLPHHKDLHVALVNQLSNCMLGFGSRKYSEEHVRSFLVAWFTDHVCHEDAKIAVYAGLSPRRLPTSA